MSIQQRLQSGISASLVPHFSEISNLSLDLVVAPIQGSVFAVILYLLFISKVVTGSAFPNLQISSFSFPNFVFWVGPDNSEDFSKLLVWSFIAGFAERLVPDTIKRIAARSISSGESTPKGG